jgi:hypothetical protein
MSGRRNLFTLLPMFVVLSASCFGGGSSSSSGATMKQSLVEAISKELPVGSDMQDVIRFLDTRRLEHSGYVEREGAIYAIARDVSGDSLIRESVQFIFAFDNNGKLEAYRVKDVFTGP